MSLKHESKRHSEPPTPEPPDSGDSRGVAIDGDVAQTVIVTGDRANVTLSYADPDPKERPVPRYPNPETRALSQALKEAYRRRAAGWSTAT